MKNKVSYLFKNVILFSLSGFVPKIISFLLVPIYTYYLSTYDYGISDLINTTASLLIPIFSLDIQDAVLRYSMDKRYKTEDVFSVAFNVNIKGLFIVIILTSILHFLNIFNIPNYFYFFLVITYFFNALYNSINLFCRGIDKVKNIVVASIINSLITLLGNIVLLIVFDLGVYGFLIANIFGTICSILYLFVKVKLHKYIHLNTDKKLLKEMIKYSFPLIFSVIAWWINTASDRYILTWIAGASVSGIYAIAYKIPTLLSVFQNIFSQAWSISAIKEFDKDDTDGFVGNMFTIMNFLMCIMCSVIMIFNIVISKILYSGDFQVAWKFVPPLLLSVVFNAMALFIGSIFTAVKDTKLLSLSTILGAVVNTILNFILITFYGAYGAALATLVGYLVVLLVRMKSVKKYINLKTNMLIHISSYGLLLLQIVLAYFGNEFWYLQVIILFLIIMLYHKYIKKVFFSLKKSISRHLKREKKKI